MVNIIVSASHHALVLLNLTLNFIANRYHL